MDATPEARVDESAARVAELEKELEQERQQRLRALADFQNYRRRSDEQRAETVRLAGQDLVTAMLPILDNFERAMAAAATSKSYDALMGGVEMTYRQLCDVLVKNGVVAIEAVGSEFDPSLHEAVMRVEDSEHPDNTVVDELQRGYMMHGRVLRPSMVRVATNG